MKKIAKEKLLLKVEDNEARRDKKFQTTFRCFRLDYDAMREAAQALGLEIAGLHRYLLRDGLNRLEGVLNAEK